MKLVQRYWLCLVLLLTGCSAGSLSQMAAVGTQEWSGELAESTIWSRNVLVRGPLIVPQDQTLTIQPGTVVLFQRDSQDRPGHLVIHGSLYAEGGDREEDHIVLAAANQSSIEWTGIEFQPMASVSRLSFCRLFNARIGVSTRSSDVAVENSLITGCQEVAIRCEDASPRIEDNQIQKNTIGIECRGDGTPTIMHNEIVTNDQGIVCSDGSHPEITFNQIKSNLEDAIWVSPPALPLIRSNNITLNGGWAVYGGGKLSENFIQGNNQAEPREIDTGTDRSSNQFYSADEVSSPRQVPVSDAGPHRRL